MRSFGGFTNLLVLLLVLSLYGCDDPPKVEVADNPVSVEIINIPRGNEIHCTDLACFGVYVGPEFIKGDDVAHQFSNKMSGKVGDELKERYAKGEFCKVDFSKIRMSTKGLGSGQVTYKLYIPFASVEEKCAAYTSFDHSGGWGHPPDLKERKEQLRSALLRGEKLNISPLKKTPEGLEEYWIQWKNKEVQADCTK